MRIALVAPLVSAIREPQGGGSQAFVSDLARGLTRRGHDVDVYAASGSQIPGVHVIDTGVDPRSLAATLFRAGQEGEAPDPGPAEAAFAGVYADVAVAKYDIVHNHAFDGPAIDGALALRAPVVHTLHLPPDPVVASALHRVARVGRAAVACCVSQAQAQAWRRLIPVEAVLPPYVPTGIIPFSPAAGTGAIYAGRLSPEKGTAQAIDIARAAGLPIDVYGDAYDPRYAREQIEPRGAEPGVTLHPGLPRTQLWARMGQAAVLLCPSLWDEPFGMAPAEAQACGTPVVAFRRGGLGEVVADGVTGFLVPPGDLEAGVAAVRRVPGLARADCRQHAVTHLDLERSVDAHERLYGRVAARAAAR
jgi:glycosyltransferase involved in cell wall biosynthesis